MIHNGIRVHNGAIHAMGSAIGAVWSARGRNAVHSHGLCGSFGHMQIMYRAAKTKRKG